MLKSGAVIALGVLLSAEAAHGQLLEVRQTIFGMD